MDSEKYLKLIKDKDLGHFKNDSVIKISHIILSLNHSNPLRQVFKYIKCIREYILKWNFTLPKSKETSVP